MAKINTEMKLIDNMSASLGRIEAKLGSLNRGMGEAASSGASLDGVFSSLRPSALAGAAGVTALVAAVAGLGSAAKSSINVASQFENMESGLSTVMQSAEKGKALFEDLRKFSLQTTFGVDTLAGVSKQLLTLGVTQDQLKGKLLTLGNLAQGNTQQFRALADAYAKVQTTGRASSIQIQQMSAIIGTSLASALGKSSASAAELDAIFEKMTADGGMFAGAMDGAINTIEGKTGFVTDTFRELQASFAEVSGLTQAWKGVLDITYNVLQGIVDAMQKLNKNPVIKWVVRGLLVAAVTSLAGVLVRSVVPALTAIATKMGIIASLKAVINPASLLVGLGVGAAVTGIGLIAEKWGEATKEMKGYYEEAGALQGKLESGSAEAIQNYAKAVEEQRRRVEEKERSVADTVVAMRKNVERAGGDISTVAWMTKTAEQELEFEREQLRMLEQRLKHEQRLADALKRRADIERTMKANAEEYDAELEWIKNEYAKTKIGQHEAQMEKIARLERLLEKGVDFSSGGNRKIVDKKDRRMITVILKELRSSVYGIEHNTENAVELTDDYRELLSAHAARIFNLNFSQTTPQANLNIEHMEVSKTADADEVVALLCNGLERAVA